MSRSNRAGSDAERTTEQIVNALGEYTHGATVMELAIRLRVPYPLVRQELDELVELGVAIRRRERSTTVWLLG